MEESNLRQENIKIGGVEIPTIHCDGEVWYPANYINRYFFKRNRRMIDKDNEVKIISNIRTFHVNFSMVKGGTQQSKCINKDGIEILLKDFNTGGLNAEQKHNYNEIIKCLGLEVNLVIEEGKDTISNNKELKQIIKKYDKFTQDCIDEIIKEHPNIKWRICNRCGKTYPLHKKFFKGDACKSSNNEFVPFCKDCGISTKANETVSKIENKPKRIGEELERIYNVYGDKVYIKYKNHDVIFIYQHWKENQYTSHIPKIIKNKVDYLHIIKYYYNKGFIDKKDLTHTYLIENYQLDGITRIATLDQIYSHLFGEDFKNYPWKYKSYSLNNIDFDNGRIIFNNYLSENNIVIDNTLDFNYGDIIKKSNLSRIFGSNLLEFAVRYNNYKYAGYKFKTQGVNYYKEKENRIFDLKYFIEKDMKILIDKIPLYITKMTLQKHARSLYSLLYSGKYYKNLYEWVNECYPNKFIESDFVIGNHRDEFGSVEESQINDILHSYFSNVIYNQLNTDRTIKFSGKTPDWIILTDKGCIIVEYFGLYVIDREIHNSRINDYINRSNNKKEIYSKLDGYKFLYFYPEDIKDNFKGVKEKIEKFIE